MELSVQQMKLFERTTQYSVGMGDVMTSGPDQIVSRMQFKTPEDVVLAGMRYWARGQALRSMDPWTEAQIIFRDYLGDAMGEQAIIALARFIAVIGRCSGCPLKVYPAVSGDLSRHEALLLGLIAAFQSGDQLAIDFCLHRLCCPNVCDEVAAVAAVFALTLKACHKTLRPLSVQQLERLLSSLPTSSLSGTSPRAIH